MEINKNLLKLFESINAYEVNSRIRPNVWFIPFIGKKKIYNHTSPQDILEIIYEKGQENGKEIGKKQIREEFKNLLEL